jgi:hypothetical protein
MKKAGKRIGSERREQMVSMVGIGVQCTIASLHKDGRQVSSTRRLAYPGRFGL